MHYTSQEQSRIFEKNFLQYTARIYKKIYLYFKYVTEHEKLCLPKRMFLFYVAVAVHILLKVDFVQ